MSTRDTVLLLDDMLDSVMMIRQYLQGQTEATFRSSQLIQDAVMRRLETLGEAANRLPPEYRAQHPELPWGSIIGTRNRLIHGYFLVDIDILWRTIQTDVPALEAPLKALRQQP